MATGTRDRQTGTTDQRGHIGWRAGMLYALLPVLVDLAFSAPHAGELRGGQLINPDSYMRLVRLREILHAGAPVDVVARDASGAGMVLHWSHLLDSLVVLLVTPLRLVLGSAHALFATALLAGPLELAALGLAVAWAAAPFADRNRLWFAPLLIALSPAVVSYGLVGVLHHHVLAMVVAVMLAGWAARVIAAAVRDASPGAAGASAGWALGAWAGLGVWLTPETVPLTAAVFGALYVAWLTMRQTAMLAATIRNTGLAFLLTVGLALAVDPPYGGYAIPEVDRLSVVFLGLALVTAATGLAIQSIDHRVTRPGMRLLASVLFGLAAGGVWLAVFRHALFGPRALLDSAAVTTMNAVIMEMKPVTTVASAVRNLLTGSLAALILAALALTRRSAVLAYAAACTIGLVAIAQQHIRFSSYPVTMGAMLLPVVLPLIEQRLHGWSERARAMPRMATLLLFLLVPFLGNLPSPFQPAQAVEPAHPGCGVSQLGRMLAPYAGKVVLTDVNEVPELLYRTRIDLVGSLYLRNAPGFMRLRAAWRSLPSPIVPPAIRAAGIRYVLFCRHQRRSSLVSDLPADTLLDRLARSEVPPWLHPVASDPASGHVLYAVVP